MQYAASASIHRFAVPPLRALQLLDGANDQLPLPLTLQIALGERARLALFRRRRQSADSDRHGALL